MFPFVDTKGAALELAAMVWASVVCLFRGHVWRDGLFYGGGADAAGPYLPCERGCERCLKQWSER